MNIRNSPALQDAITVYDNDINQVPRRWFYITTLRGEYRGFTHEEAIHMWELHRLEDTTAIQHFGSVG